MLNKLFVAATVLLAACATDDVEGEPEPERTTAAFAKDDSSISATDEHVPSVCDHIVDTEGPCAVACDPEKLFGFIPEGACVLFKCELDDGSFYNTGGCN